jgi:7-keto-8-aminopelargonate synthetase-like enzyme
MGTLGKAVGTSGAYIVGSDSAIQYFLNRARSFLFATAPPPATAAATVAALQIIQSEPERRTRLWDNRAYLYAGLNRLGYRMSQSQSPIMPIITGDPTRTLILAEELLHRGIFAPAIRPPTVPKETSRIRITVTSEHTRAHLDDALTAFEKAGQAVGVI